MLKNDDDLFEFVENKQYLMTWFDNKTNGKFTLSTEDIGFGLAPLINSAKRKGDEQLVGDWITESDEMKSQIQFEPFGCYQLKGGEKDQTKFPLDLKKRLVPFFYWLHFQFGNPPLEENQTFLIWLPSFFGNQNQKRVNFLARFPFPKRKEKGGLGAWGF